MRRFAAEMAEACGPERMLIEYGSGSGLKTRLLLDALERPAVYVPIDISRSALESSAASLARSYPGLEIVPLCADYTADYSLPKRKAAGRVVYFPGSTLGNFEPEQAQGFLKHVAQRCSAGDGLLLGLDLHKDASILEPAYDDARGVTAAFELNLLARLNREFRADFELDAFRYDSFYNEPLRRIEMCLVSRRPQRVRIAGREIAFAAGERILTEYSYKFGPHDVEALASAAGYRVERVWLDPDERFSVQFLRLG